MARQPLYSAGGANGAVAVVASDSDDIPVTHGLAVTTAGLAKLTFVDGSVATDFPLIAGYNPIHVTRVWSTGTTAAGIFRLT